MLDGIAAAEVLRGVRGRRASTARRSPRMIERVSDLVADFPEIAEVDLNPVFATPEGATAADVRIVLARPRRPTSRPSTPTRRSSPR